MTHVTPEWLTVSGVESALTTEPDAELAGFCAGHRLKTIPLLRNLVGDKWQPEAVEALARADGTRQNAFIALLVSRLRQLGASGVLLDFNELDPALSAQFTSLFHRCADA